MAGASEHKPCSTTAKLVRNIGLYGSWLAVTFVLAYAQEPFRPADRDKQQSSDLEVQRCRRLAEARQQTSARARAPRETPGQRPGGCFRRT